VKGRVEGVASTVWVGKHSPHNRDILLTGSGKEVYAIFLFNSSQVGEKEYICVFSF